MYAWPKANDPAGEELASFDGDSWSDETVAKGIEEVLSEHLESRGIKYLAGSAPLKWTVKNIKQRLLDNSCGDLAATMSVIAKTNRRFTAENSLMSSFALALLVGYTHFIVGDAPANMKLSEKLGAGAKLMMEIVSKANGDLPVYPVKPQYITTTDDTTEYIFRGTATDKDPTAWHIVTGGLDRATRATRSAYSVTSNNKALNRFRVKLAHTFSGGGHMAPIYITVTGLSEGQLPSSKCEDGMLVVEVPGLCIGSTSDLRIREIGYIVFLRKTDDNRLDQRRFLHYRDYVYRPFVAMLRKRYDGHVAGTAVPNELTAVSWCDGD